MPHQSYAGDGQLDGGQLRLSLQVLELAKGFRSALCWLGSLQRQIRFPLPFNTAPFPFGRQVDSGLLPLPPAPIGVWGVSEDAGSKAVQASGRAGHDMSRLTIFCPSATCCLVLITLKTLQGGMGAGTRSVREDNSCLASILNEMHAVLCCLNVPTEVRGQHKLMSERRHEIAE